MTYKEYREIRQNGFNALPIFFAFGMEQFKEQMEKRGLTVNDTDKIYALGAGGYYLRSDADKIRAFFSKKDELPELMKDPVFAEDAFYSEMVNHEYGINAQGDWGVCSCFGNCEYVDGKEGTEYLKDMGYGRETIVAYSDAENRYFKQDWC